MKALLLNYEYPPLGGGAANATYYLLKEFAGQRDLQIDLVTSSVNKEKVEDLAKNIRIHKLDIGKRGSSHYQTNKDLLRYSWKAYWKARGLNKEKDYDLVHAFFGIPCGFLAMLLGKPYIVSLRGSDVPFYNPRFKWADRLAFRYISRYIWSRASAVIANSQKLKELALETAPQQEIKVIYNGVNTREFQPVEKNNHEFVVLSTSRLIKRKGIGYLLRGFAKFARERNKVKLLLIGEGNRKGHLKLLAQSLSISDKVEFRGNVPHNKMPQIYAEADVFVLPSLNEGMSNSLLEAMASGLPVIVTPTGGTQELVDFKNGFIVEPKNSDEIAQALQKLYNDPDLLEQMQLRSRKKAERLSWGKVARKYRQLYQQLATTT